MKPKNCIEKSFTRREANKLLLSAFPGMLALTSWKFRTENMMRTRKIPSTGELLPVVGLGTWQTFDVGNDPQMKAQLSEVLKEMKKYGGKLIDSSPMYGRSEQVVGELTAQLGLQDYFFLATKVWTYGKQSGIDQMDDSFRLMKTKAMDLMQIHNLMDWEAHSRTLKQWKEEGRVRYWGITHYTNSSHDDLVDIMVKQKPDFVQCNFSINQRHAEERLFPAALENGVAVIINRPYDGGILFRKTKNTSLPEWCEEFEIHSWGQFFLKYILSYKAVNCVIPGTSKPHHLVDNMKAGYGPLPDSKTRKLMVKWLESL